MDTQDHTLSAKNSLNTSRTTNSLTLTNPLPAVESADTSRVSSPGALVQQQLSHLHLEAGVSLSTGDLTSIHQQYVATQQIGSQHIALVEHFHAGSSLQSGPPQMWQVKAPIASFTGRESRLGQF